MPKSKNKQSSDKEIEFMEPKVDRMLGFSQYNVVPPGPFDFSKPADWPKWKRKFERFRHASELYLKPASQQVSMFMYCLGDEGEDLLDTFDLSMEGKNNFEQVLQQFEKY